MKTLISAVILSTISFGVSATSCEAIGRGVVDQYSAAGGFSNETAAQKVAYEDLVSAHVRACQGGVALRNSGKTAKEVEQIIAGAYAGEAKSETITPVISKSMTITSYTQGYAFGE